jgi:hypothetical protein
MINHPNRSTRKNATPAIPAPGEDGCIRFDFGVKDRLGRGMGYIVRKTPTKHAFGGPIGLYFTASVTRNGFFHQSQTYYGPFATEADRDRKIADVSEAARKRALAPSARLKS